MRPKMSQGRPGRGRITSAPSAGMEGVRGLWRLRAFLGRGWAAPGPRQKGFEDEGGTLWDCEAPSARGWPLNSGLRPSHAGLQGAGAVCPSQPSGPLGMAHQGHSGLGVSAPGPGVHPPQGLCPGCNRSVVARAGWCGFGWLRYAHTGLCGRAGRWVLVGHPCTKHSLTWCRAGS